MTELVVLTVLYFVPLLVAIGRHHHNLGAIAVVNVLLGWTVIGWIVALAMASGRVIEPEARG